MTAFVAASMTFQPIAGNPAVSRQYIAYDRGIAGYNAPSMILDLVARHVRRQRQLRRWTIRELAERSGVSVRFLGQLEAGAANISVKRLADVAKAFALPPADFLRDDVEEEHPTVALLGL